MLGISFDDNLKFSSHIHGIIYIINSLESVQRGFTKSLNDLHYTLYADRLSTLKLQSLEHRRLINNLVMCYNIIYNRTALIFEKYFSIFS